MEPGPDALVAAMPFARLLGMTVDEASGDRVVARLEHRPELCTAGDLLHGGALMTPADSTGRAVRVPRVARGCRNRDDELAHVAVPGRTVSQTAQTQAVPT